MKKVFDKATVPAEAWEFWLNSLKWDGKDRLRAFMKTWKRVETPAEYLKRLKWDKKPRIIHVPELIGAEDTPTVRNNLRRWFVNAIRRTLEPGCAIDCILTLYGPRSGENKFLEIMFGNWLCEYGWSVILKKEGIMLMRDAWVVKLRGVFDSIGDMNKRELEAVKNFLNSGADIYRVPYGNVKHTLRPWFIVTSDNENMLLDADTKFSRFWSLKLGTMNQSHERMLSMWRDQIWAEAMVIYKKNLTR